MKSLTGIALDSLAAGQQRLLRMLRAALESKERLGNILVSLKSAMRWFIFICLLFKLKFDFHKKECPHMKQVK